MNERPILFSGPMVRAILDGRKTQTRRVVKIKSGEPKTIFPLLGRDNLPTGEWFFADPEFERVGSSGHFCPYGKPGDRLWVRETFCPFTTKVYTREGMTESAPKAIYKADGGSLLNGYKWKPSLYMPRWASRITLEITEVRVERLQKISEADAWDEGIKRTGYTPEEFARNQAGDRDVLIASVEQPLSSRNFPSAKEAFAFLWESVNGPGSWDANPWVWAISFRPIPTAVSEVQA